MCRFLATMTAALILTAGAPAYAGEPEPEPAATAEAAGNEAAETAAVAAAEAWLALVDAGSYAESWDGAAKLMQGAISKADWETSLTGVRTPLGKLVSRKVSNKTYATSLPGAPDGEYVVIQFETAFENKAAAVETITPMKEADGSWKVSGFFIK